MNLMTVANTQRKAIKEIANDIELSEELVELIVDQFIGKIVRCLESEAPFQIPNLFTIHFKYLYKRGDTVTRILRVKPTRQAQTRFEGRVFDIGVPTNMREDLLKLKIEPTELEKARKKKVLESQQELGFRSELLFDEPSEEEKNRDKELGQPPTIEQIVKRLDFDLEF